MEMGHSGTGICFFQGRIKRRHTGGSSLQRFSPQLLKGWRVGVGMTDLMWRESAGVQKGGIHSPTACRAVVVQEKKENVEHDQYRRIKRTWGRAPIEKAEPP